MSYQVQREIEFFWPLTEQIPLDLDFSQCAPHLYYIKAKGQPLDGPFPTGTVWASSPTTTAGIILEAGTLTIKTPSMPWYRKLAYRIMGFKWE